MSYYGDHRYLGPVSPYHSKGPLDPVKYRSDPNTAHIICTTIVIPIRCHMDEGLFWCQRGTYHSRLTLLAKYFGCLFENRASMVSFAHHASIELGDLDLASVKLTLALTY